MPDTSTPPPIVLASQSPRRRELLTLVGITHEVRPADIDESVMPDELPVPHCERLARAKAGVLAVQHPEAVVIAADTIVVIDQESAVDREVERAWTDAAHHLEVARRMGEEPPTRGELLIDRERAGVLADIR